MDKVSQLPFLFPTCFKFSLMSHLFNEKGICFWFVFFFFVFFVFFVF
jgi:hypothetical protein